MPPGYFACVTRTSALKSFLLLFATAAAGVAGCRQPVYGPATQVDASARSHSWDFSSSEPDKLPRGWKSHGGTWQVVEDPTAPSAPVALAQLAGSHSGSHFNLAVADQPELADLTLSLKYRAVAGQEDQGGGPVWRYRDPENYYIARENPLEGNYRVYKVVKGRRIQLGSADVKAPSGEWHSLEITMIGSHIECSLNGRKYLDVKDETFTAAGRVGLWTKADAQTQFDDVNVRGR